MIGSAGAMQRYCQCHADLLGLTPSDDADGRTDLWIGHVKLISSKGRDVGLDASSAQGHNVQRAIQCKVLDPVCRVAFMGWLQPWYPCTQCQRHHALHSIASCLLKHHKHHDTVNDADMKAVQLILSQVRTGQALSFHSTLF